MSIKWISGVAALLSALVAFTCGSPVAAQQYSDLSYFTVPGCVAVDTRSVGGAFAASETRTYTVTGTSSLASQGGSASGCGVPAFSNTVAQVQAVSLNVIAIATTGSGFLLVFPSDKPPTVSLLNFAASDTISTNVVVPVNQTSGTTGDIKVEYGIAGGHLLVAVTGYYASPQQTVHVHPVPGNPAASGAALLNAFSNLAALTGSIAPSSTRQYVVQLDPGIYDLGTTPLNLLSYVDLAGAGRRDATIIRGTGYGTGLNDGIITAYQVTSLEVYDLNIQASVTSGSNLAIGMWISLSPVSVRRVSVITTASSGSAAWGIRSIDSATGLEDVACAVFGGQNNYAIVFEGSSVPSFPTAHRIFATASGATSQNNGIYVSDNASPTLHVVEATASGGAQAAAIRADYGNGFSTGGTLTLFDSVLTASGGSSNYGLATTGTSNTFIIEQTKIVASSGTSYGLTESNLGNTYLINRSTLSGGTGSVHLFSSFSAGASQLVGSVSPTAGTCAACYDGSYTALSSTCH
jgi:hypothetical protein